MKKIDIWYFDDEPTQVNWIWFKDEFGLIGTQECFRKSRCRSTIFQCKHDSNNGPEINFKYNDANRTPSGALL